MGDPNENTAGALTCASATALLKFATGLLELGIIYYLVSVLNYGFWKMLLVYMFVDIFLDSAVSWVLSYAYAWGNVTKEDVAKVMFDYQMRLQRIPKHKDKK